MEVSYNPVLAAPSVRQKMRTAEGQQVGAINHRAALAPLLPFQLQPDQHFESALELSVQPLPTEVLPILDDDLRFAASFSSLPGVDLSRLRKCAMGLLAEMKRRWGKITAHLRSKQTEAIRTATAQRDVGFTAILLLLANWGDVTLPAGLCLGLPAVGYAPPYGIFPEQEATRLTREDVLQDWQSHNRGILARLKPGADDEFMLQQSLKGSRGLLMMLMLAYNLSNPAMPTSLPSAQRCDQLSIFNIPSPMEHSPSGIPRNGSQVARTGLMPTDSVP